MLYIALDNGQTINLYNTVPLYHWRIQELTEGGARGGSGGLAPRYRRSGAAPPAEVQGTEPPLGLGASQGAEPPLGGLGGAPPKAEA